MSGFYRAMRHGSKCVSLLFGLSLLWLGMLCNNTILLYCGMTFNFIGFVLVDPAVFDHWIWRCWRKPVSLAFGNG